MDNGMGVVEEALVAQSQSPLMDDRVSESLSIPSQLPESKEHEGEEVFEEAVEAISDDGAESLKEDSNEGDDRQLRTTDGSVACEPMEEVNWEESLADQNHRREGFEDGLAGQGEGKYSGSVDRNDAMPASDASFRLSNCLLTQRSQAVQQAIRQSAGDMRLMNPVSLVENHTACRTNRDGQRVLPNGQVWKPHLLLLSFASKILAEANTLLKLQDTIAGNAFAARARALPLPALLSSLLQSRPQLKLPNEQFSEEGDDDLDDDLSDSDNESEYDELPPFRPLGKSQLANLTREQRKAYDAELEYREKLFMKKQLKEEKKRRKFMKKMAEAAKGLPSEIAENVEEEESSSAASLPVPMPDLALPASFDADNPTHRYRHLDTSDQWLIRPILDAHGWDHDVGYEAINVERLFVVKDKVPVSFSGLVSKDKREASLQMEVATSVKHGEGKGTTLGFDMQSAGKDMAYTMRSETKFCNHKHNKASAGLSFTLLGDAITAGLKLEDKLLVNNRFRMVMSGGAMMGRGDIACGGSLEATLRDKEHPLGRFLSTLGVSVMDWHGDLAIGANIQSQIPIGRSSNLIARANLNNRGAGQVSIRMNSSEQIQIALIGVIPLLLKLWTPQSSS